MSAHSIGTDYDVAVVGGGIHGVSMACEAAGRGLRVILLEGGDLAAGASSATSTMLTGDLRRVEQLALGQVRQRLLEQALLLERAPHLVQTRPYFAVPDPKIRSNLRLSGMLWLYRRLQRVPSDSAITRRSADAPERLLTQPEVSLYHCHDCSVLDYRLVIATALQASTWGANILPRHRVVAAERQTQRWTLRVEPQTGPAFVVNARCLINSCGWLANDFLERVLKVSSRCRARPLNLGYLMIAKPWPDDNGYLLQAPDRRLAYVTPFLNRYLLIGPALAEEESQKEQATEELLALFNRHFEQPVARENLVHQRWSKHAVFDDPRASTSTRRLGEVMLDLNNPYGDAPLLNVFGINLLMHRRLAERALDILGPFTGKGADRKLKQQKLPGGESASGDPSRLSAELRQAYPALNQHLLDRLALNYGSLSYRILGERQTMTELGQRFGKHLHEAEVRYLRENEWAVTAEDILWRRTQLGLEFSPTETQELQQWLDRN